MQVYVAKRELFNIPVFGWGLRLVKTIGIDRGNGNQANQQLAQQGAARKQEGFWITIFPEGTRVPAGTKGRYKLGAARMAKLFEMDMVPVALNSGNFGHAIPFKIPWHHRRYHWSTHLPPKRR